MFKIVRYVNNVAFTLFVFCYFFGLQSNYLFFLIHRFTGVSANMTLVAIGATALLSLLQCLLNNTFRLHGRFHAFSFIPITVLLLLLTPSIISVLLGLILLIIYIRIVIHNKYNRIFSSDIYIIMRKNLIMMIFLFFCVALCGMRTEIKTLIYATQRHILNRDYNGALSVGENSLATDSTLTFFRAYSLNHQNLIGERLFEFPLSGKSTDLIFHGNKDELFIEIDSADLFEMSSHEFYLCALLLDKRLTTFVNKLSELYKGKLPTDSLPKHYREAIMLYNHLHVNSLIVYRNAVMQTNLDDFLDIQKNATSPSSKNNLTRSSYGNTYWWYYFYK